MVGDPLRARLPVLRDEAAAELEIDGLPGELALTMSYVVALLTNYRVLQYVICGTGAMQDALEEALGDLRVPGGRVHTERFNFVQRGLMWKPAYAVDRDRGCPTDPARLRGWGLAVTG